MKQLGSNQTMNRCKLRYILSSMDEVQFYRSSFDFPLITLVASICQRSESQLLNEKILLRQILHSSCFQRFFIQSTIDNYGIVSIHRSILLVVLLQFPYAQKHNFGGNVCRSMMYSVEIHIQSLVEIHILERNGSRNFDDKALL